MEFLYCESAGRSCGRRLRWKEPCEELRRPARGPWRGLVKRSLTLTWREGLRQQSARALRAAWERPSSLPPLLGSVAMVLFPELTLSLGRERPARPAGLPAGAGSTVEPYITLQLSTWKERPA